MRGHSAAAAAAVLLILRPTMLPSTATLTAHVEAAIMIAKKAQPCSIEPPLAALSALGRLTPLQKLQLPIG
jgi:hypothetical protein